MYASDGRKDGRDLCGVDIAAVACTEVLWGKVLWRTVRRGLDVLRDRSQF